MARHMTGTLDIKISSWPWPLSYRATFSDIPDVHRQNFLAEFRDIKSILKTVNCVFYLKLYGKLEKHQETMSIAAVSWVLI